MIFFYIKDSVTTQNNDNTESSDTPYLRICDIHADNMTVEANFQTFTKNYHPEDVCIVTESVFGRQNDVNPMVIYNANSFFCPAFEDVKYNDDHWDKINIKKNLNNIVYQKLYLPLPEPKSKNEQTVDQYSSKRNIYMGMWYIITHNCCCQLTMFSGFLNDLVDDYYSFYGLLDGDANFLCATILAIVSSLIDYLSLTITVPMSELIEECNRERSTETEENNNNRSSIMNTIIDVEDDMETKIILKHLINIQLDVRCETKNSLKEYGNASSNDVMSILQTTLNECCNCANMYRFANLMINYNVKYEYGWVFINLQKLTRVLVTGFVKNWNGTQKLNITLGKTFSLDMCFSYIRLHKNIQNFPTKPLLYKNGRADSRYHKRKHKSEINGDSKKQKTDYETQINSNDIDDDNLIFEIAAAEEELYYSELFQNSSNIIDNCSEDITFTPTSVIEELNLPSSKVSKKTCSVLESNETILTVVELFPLKPALTSTVASLQGSELDTPHCLFVKKNSDAHNLIVGTSRAKNNIENLKFCFETDVDQINIKPLSDTKVFVQKTILSQVKNGFLEQNKQK